MLDGVILGWEEDGGWLATVAADDELDWGAVDWLT